jgi:hypothetical protein
VEDIAVEDCKAVIGRIDRAMVEHRAIAEEVYSLNRFPWLPFTGAAVAVAGGIAVAASILMATIQHYRC